MKKFPFKSASIDVEKKINLDEGIIPFILTSLTVDRDSEVVLPDGGDTTEFKKNPVFMWAHNIWAPSIGRVIPETLKATTKKMTADVEFDLDDPFAAMIFNKYTKGHLNAGSIRFRPIEISKDPVLPKQKRDTIKKWKLLEFSACPVPSNPDALAQIQKAFSDLDDDRAREWLDGFKELLEDPDSGKSMVDLYIDNMNSTKGDEFEPDHLTTHDEHAEWLGFKHSLGIEEGETFKQELKDLFFDSEDGQKPFPSEHSCRVKDPGNYVRFRRQSRKHNGKTYFAIIGFKKGGGSEDQAYRYPKKTWTPASAKAHCKNHDGISFEAAKKELDDEQLDVGIVEFNVLQDLITVGIQKAMNPLLLDEFQYKDEKDEPDWILLANAMINLFRNKTLPDYQKRAVYDHLAEQYKKFDRKPPEFGEEPEEVIEPPVVEVYIPNETSINKIISEVVKQIKK